MTKMSESVRRLSERGGKGLPFLRWSVVRMALGGLHLVKDWQVGDGREEALADHVPGAAEYRSYMNTQEGEQWHTTEHPTHAEYQTLIKDLVLESTYLGA
jgi:hypothetical protein